MFSQTNYTEQDSTKTKLALAKTNSLSKYTLSVQKSCYSQHKCKDLSKNYYPFIILFMSSRNESVNVKLPKY